MELFDHINNRLIGYKKEKEELDSLIKDFVSGSWTILQKQTILINDAYFKQTILSSQISELEWVIENMYKL